MIKRTLFTISLFSVISSHGQFMDDFKDGDLVNNVLWTGNTSDFEVDTNQKLHLNAAPVANASYLVCESAAINNAVWEFAVRMDFNPSSSNFADVFLISDNENLEDDLNGYFVRIGNSSDEISLYKIESGSIEEIIDGEDDLVNLNPVEVAIKVTRDEVGNWNLYADTLGGSDYILLGNAFDNSIKTAQYFGLKCTYSATRSDLFYFDDFKVSGDPYVDTDAPILEDIVVLDDQNLRLVFNEAIDLVSAKIGKNYNVNQGILSPEEVNFISDNSIELAFSNAFQNGQYYQLQLSNLSDLSGNTISDQSHEFIYFIPGIPKAGSVIINEIFADPTPSQGLEEVEYIEIFNAGNEVYNLENWVLVNSTIEKELPYYPFLKETYLILCDEDDAELMSEYGNVIGIPSFTALNNSSDSLSIKDNNGILLDVVVYHQNWHSSSEFEFGGYALERINPIALCSGSHNWSTSTAIEGGSPGEENSIYDSSPDTKAPEILEFKAESLQSIVIIFNETMDEISLEFGSYSIDGGISVNSSTLIGSYKDRVRLSLSEALNPSNTYILSAENIFDCEGNALASNQVEILLGYEPEYADIIITEIMADPSPFVGLPEAEYIEIYNNSDRLINLGGCSLDEAIIPDHSFLNPGDYLILGSINHEIDFFSYENFVGITPWSDTFLSNSGESIELRDKNKAIINSVEYHYEVHSLNKREGGWSLEIQNIQEWCRGMDNWSSSINTKGGSPGEQNSVYSEVSDETSPILREISFIDEQKIDLHFNEVLDSDLTNIKIQIDQALFSSATEMSSDRTVLVQLAPNMEEGKVYNLEVSGIKDCVGNQINTDNSGVFALPEDAEAGDIVINEVLFNPPEEADDFVEIYNRSEKVINLNQWRLANNDNGIPGNQETICEYGKLIFPGDFLALTTNSDDLAKSYPFSNPKAYYVMDDLPSYNNDEGSVYLMMPNAELSDEFYYQEEYHFTLLDDVKGVSLERIDIDRVTNDPSNWHSASSTEAYGTPGKANSQFFQGSISESSIQIEPELFSPDNDGFEDFLNINYLFDEPGYLASINIFDSRGAPVKTLLSNELMGSTGIIKWDGSTDENSVARVGVYIIFIEIFDLEGNISVFKKTCVVGNRF